METAKKENATPFDFPGVELMHFQENGKEYVSFDANFKAVSMGLDPDHPSNLKKVVRW